MFENKPGVFAAGREALLWAGDPGCWFSVGLGTATLSVPNFLGGWLSRWYCSPGLPVVGQLHFEKRRL